jgi:hypothetical protein
MQWIIYRAIDDWRIAFLLLGTWWAIAAAVIWLVQRLWCSKHRAENPRRYRFWFAMAVAVIFTPSLVSDFWLFDVPGPAILGFYLCFAAGFEQPAYWFAALLYYVLPMAAIFGITYYVLLRRDRHFYATPTA